MYIFLDMAPPLSDACRNRRQTILIFKNFTTHIKKNMNRLILIKFPIHLGLMHAILLANRFERIFERHGVSIKMRCKILETHSNTAICFSIYVFMFILLRFGSGHPFYGTDAAMRFKRVGSPIFCGKQPTKSHLNKSDDSKLNAPVCQKAYRCILSYNTLYLEIA